MLRALRDKFLRLGRDDDGVALVTTLAIFMFMYLVCMGVYAIGAAVKTRTHLQNACDAAAYSAAVVQADTLSRIATINRAMAWTYIAMSRRQMDYIVDRWLTRTVEKVQGDVDKAKASGTPGVHYPAPDHMKYWALKPTFPMSPSCHAWDDEDHESVRVRLNTFAHRPNVGSRYKNGSIKYELANFEDTWFRDASFYKGNGRGIGVMQSQIAADKDTLKKMFEAEKTLVADLPGRVEEAVADILKANVVHGLTYRHEVFQSASPYGGGDSYLDVLDSSKEKRFLAFANYRPANWSKPFGKGSGMSQWFPLSGGEGFCRGYRQTGTLRSSWSWRSWKWICSDDGCIKMPAGFGSGSCLGMECHDSYFDGVAAKPLVLTQDYFSKNGTITVGLAVENDNPWEPIFRLVSDSWRNGIFAAFSIGKNLPWTPQYTVCFASAKAGYKETARLNWGNTRAVETEDRAYRVDWEDGDWNLCQSDLDAVLIPVRRAETLASGGSWGGGNLNFLDGYAQKLGANDTVMKAGGDGLDVATHYDGRDLSDEYRFGNKVGFWGGAQQPQNLRDPSNGEQVNAKWQIQNPNKPIRWDGLQKVMFH